MTSSEYEVFLTGAMLICAVMAIVVAFRAKSRGTSAFIMSAAFVVFGLELYLVKSAAPQGWLIAGGVVLAALLVTDFVLRALQQPDKGKRQ